MGKQGSFIKRLTDIIVSLFSLILFSPVFLITSIAIKLDSRGPVFFLHERTGLDAKPFKMIKFRGMIDNALKYGPGITQLNDPRITKVGKFLRRTSIDELPQLFNVLKGEMSIIGPRAVTQEEIDNYGENASLIIRVKPGITGWWQVTGRNETTWEQRTKLEVYYVSNWSLWLDLYILYKTIWVVLSGTGT